MKLGTENKRTTVMAAALGVVAILLFLRMLSVMSAAGKTPVAAPAAASTLPPAQARHRTAAANRQGRDRVYAPSGPQASLDPRLHLDLLQASDSVEYKGSGRDIFGGASEPEIPQPIKPGLTDHARYIPPPPPPPPPIPLKFYGWASRPGEQKRIFLTDNGDVLGPAGEGDIVERRYKIVRISPGAVEIEDMLSNNRQTIPLNQG